MDSAPFPPTPWTSVVEAASRDPERVREAMLKLCSCYRDAICAWFRRDARTRQEAEDLAHDFLSCWLAREAPLGQFTRGERRFREFLGVCLRRFAVTRHERQRAMKRGGGAMHVAWSDDQVAAGSSLDYLDLGLAREVHRATLTELTERWKARLPPPAWKHLCWLAWSGDLTVRYEDQAAALGLPVGTLKGWVFRLRQEHYEGFRIRVRALTDPDDLNAEVRHLLTVLIQGGLDDRAV